MSVAGKSILNELECLVEDVIGAMENLSPFQDDSFADRLNEEASTDDKVVFFPLFSSFLFGPSPLTAPEFGSYCTHISTDTITLVSMISTIGI